MRYVQTLAALHLYTLYSNGVIFVLLCIDWVLCEREENVSIDNKGGQLKAKTFSLASSRIGSTRLSTATSAFR
jgi:hypothetical protein